MQEGGKPRKLTRAEVSPGEGGADSWAGLPKPDSQVCGAGRGAGRDGDTGVDQSDNEDPSYGPGRILPLLPRALQLGPLSLSLLIYKMEVIKT